MNRHGLKLWPAAAIAAVAPAAAAALAAGVPGAPAVAPLAAMLGATSAMGAAAWIELRRDAHLRYRRSEALLAITSTLNLRCPLPPVNPWGATPQFMRDALDLVLRAEPLQVLELGSGTSSVIVAAALAELGRGHLITVDHEAEYAAQTRRNLADHRLTPFATVLHAPLRECQLEGATWRWYDPDVLAGIAGDPVDLLIVDGPPGKLQRLARYPALPLLRDRLSPRASILLDDTARRDETQIIARWLSAEPDWRTRTLPGERGTVHMWRVAP